MSPALELALILILAAALSAASAIAGILWWRTRTRPLLDAARLAAELAERQRALEVLLARFEAAEQKRSPSPKRTPSTASRTLRRDAAEPIPGPTLIAVPDLAVPAEPSGVSEELTRRFGAIWELADAGHGAAAIARRTGQPIGQVELILGLRRGLAAAEASP